MSFFKDFFSTSNDINENIVIGCIFVVALLVCTFVPVVTAEKYYTLAGLTAAFFGLGALKR